MTSNRKRKNNNNDAEPSSIPFADGFKLATTNEQLEAIGKGEDIPSSLFPFPELFPSIPQPCHEDDWLVQYPTRGQTFQMWLKDKDTRLPDATRNVLYLRSVKCEDSEVELDKLLEFVSLYYPGISVKTMEPLKVALFNKRLCVHTKFSKPTSVEWRKGHKWSKVKNPKGQISVFPLLDALKEEFAKDAFCVVGVTGEDLYEGPDDDFVIGMAGCGGQVGVFSFARYDPCFPTKSRDKNKAHLLLARSCKVLVHEIGHLFNLDHCPYFACCMNGSGHVEEDNRQPLHFCPICLAKLQHVTKCDLLKRYEGLLRFYEKNQFHEEALWVKKILEKIHTDQSSVTPVEKHALSTASTANNQQ